MALVTLQRSPTPSAASSTSTTTTNAGEDFGSDDERRIHFSLSESFFMVKGAALFLQQGSSPQCQKAHPHHKHAGELPQHLQVMINVLRSEDKIKLAVRLESAWSDRVRYMVVVYTSGRQDTEENILLGMDFTHKDSKSCSVGMVLPLWSDTKIHLDGDGGFTVNTASRTHVFKPVSVQAMWSAIQVLHKACEVSRRHNYFPGGVALMWMGYYESCIASEQSCINEWNTMRDLETTRPDSPTMFVDKPSERERTEFLVKAKLRSIMMCQDLENVTSKQIRIELEQHMNCNLNEYKEFIDNEMLLILGQMDKASLVFDHLYLGSEWNASNLEELQESGVGYILNVTREIDNFFPGMFSYHNIRVYDEDSTDLLAHWNETYNFIVKAKKNRSKCLVHCKMGVSRSASTVIAYAMKEYGWSLEKAYSFVKQKRSITRPNTGFMRQLAEYEGILDASKQRHNKLWRPDPDCEMAEGQCEADGVTPEPGAPPCCQEAPCRAVSLEVDPAYTSYYFRRLSDSALDSEPSTPVRAPPLLNADKVFIAIEDVERDALLDDEAFLGAHCGPPVAGGRGTESLEELRLRLECSTVVEEDEEEEEEEEVQKEEAEMEVLVQPDGEGGEKAEAEGNGMDLATLNENCNNNNNRLSTPPHNRPQSAPSPEYPATPPPPPPVSGPHGDPQQREDLPALDSKMHPSPPSSEVSSVPQSLSSPDRTRSPVAPPPALCPHCDRANCAALPCAARDALLSPIVSEALPELVSMGTATAAPQSPEALVQLQRSGLVRRRAERLERISGVCQEGLSPLAPFHSCLGIKKSSPLHPREQEELSGLPGDLPKSSTPRQACLEPLVLPLTDEALLGALTPASSPHGSALTRSSSSDSLRSVRGKPGLVRQRAQEIEARMRLAGLTVPSRLKRSNSLAKLGSLELSTEDLCSACSSDASTLLLLSLSPEPRLGPEWDCSPTASTQPRKHWLTPERALTGEPGS